MLWAKGRYSKEGRRPCSTIELIEARPGCFTKEEFAAMLGVSVATAVLIANKLAEVKVLEKRIRFEGEEGRLVYCSSKQRAEA